MLLAWSALTANLIGAGPGIFQKVYLVATDSLSRSQSSHLQNGNIICSVLETIRISSLICHVLDQSGSRKIATFNLKIQHSGGGIPGSVCVRYFWTTDLPRCGRLFVILACLLLHEESASYRREDCQARVSVDLSTQAPDTMLLQCGGARF